VFDSKSGKIRITPEFKATNVTASNADSDLLKNKNVHDAVTMHRRDLCLCSSSAQTQCNKMKCVHCIILCRLQNQIIP